MMHSFTGPWQQELALFNFVSQVLRPMSIPEKVVKEEGGERGETETDRQRQRYRKREGQRDRRRKQSHGLPLNFSDL